MATTSALSDVRHGVSGAFFMSVLSMLVLFYTVILFLALRIIWRSRRTLLRALLYWQFIQRENDGLLAPADPARCRLGHQIRTQQSRCPLGHRIENPFDDRREYMTRQRRQAPANGHGGPCSLCHEHVAGLNKCWRECDFGLCDACFSLDYHLCDDCFDNGVEVFCEDVEKNQQAINRAFIAEVVFDGFGPLFGLFIGWLVARCLGKDRPPWWLTSLVLGLFAVRSTHSEWVFACRVGDFDGRLGFCAALRSMLSSDFAVARRRFAEMRGARCSRTCLSAPFRLLSLPCGRIPNWHGVSYGFAMASALLLPAEDMARFAHGWQYWPATSVKPVVLYLGLSGCMLVSWIFAMVVRLAGLFLWEVGPGVAGARINLTEPSVTHCTQYQAALFLGYYGVSPSLGTRLSPYRQQANKVVLAICACTCEALPWLYWHQEMAMLDFTPTTGFTLVLSILRTLNRIKGMWSVWQGNIGQPGQVRVVSYFTGVTVFLAIILLARAGFVIACPSHVGGVFVGCVAPN